ncbi:MAG: hypothetical protein VYE73_13740 [Acidobacteriota bacterium]|nr:hypothetical protein [Acidobacteriota bacterium]
MSESVGINNVFQIDWESEERQIQMLRATVAVFRRELCREGEQLLLKLSSWNSTCLDLYRAAFPGTPQVFIYRDPVEVLVSLLSGRPEWLDFEAIRRRLRAERQDRFTKWFAQAGDPDEQPLPQYLGRLLGEICRWISEEKGILCVSYADLPGAIVTDIAPHLGLRLSGRAAQQVLDATTWNTKSMARASAFESDSRKKREGADASVRRAAASFVEPRLAAIH